MSRRTKNTEGQAPRIDYNRLALRLAGEKYEDPIKQAIKVGLQASCTVYVRSSEPRMWTGSGFHVGDGKIITASHVCPPETPSTAEIIVTFDQKSYYKATLLVSEPEIDVAVLECPDATRVAGAVKLGDSATVEPGDIIAVIASPEGWHDTVTVGRISNIHQRLGKFAPTEAWNDVIFIDADILQGASGGMVIGTDAMVYGAVIGVAGQMAQFGLGERAATPSSKIIALLGGLPAIKH